MSLLDVLLSADESKLMLQESKEYEITRLSKAFGEKFVLSVYPLNNSQVEYISEVSKGDMDIRKNAIVEAVRISGEKLTNKEVLDKFGVVSGKEVVSKLLRPGEITALYYEINDLSGYNRDAIKEIKKK